MAKFLINKLSEDGLVGETNQMPAILHNLMIIGSKYKEGFMAMVERSSLPFVVQVCVCGRFVTYIFMHENLKDGLMRFCDLRNDDDLALDAARNIYNEWYGGGINYSNWFMEEYTKLKEVYKDNYDAAELVLTENAGLLLN